MEMCVPSRYSDDLDVELFIRESVLEFNQARYEFSEMKVIMSNLMKMRINLGYFQDLSQV